MADRHRRGCYQLAGRVTSAYPERNRSSWIVSQRPARNVVDPFQPYGFFLEQEPDASGRILRSGVILLTNKECPWRCLMCDLWKNTLTSSVPIGAIPAQIDQALSSFRELPQQIKLYNSGSFFDPAAIPREDYVAIAQRVAFAERVVVECHPRLIGKSALAFRDGLNGHLEVAMGLETANPKALERLNKKFTLDQFASAADFLRANQIALRVFLLVNPPFVDSSEALEWTVKSATLAFDCGAAAVSLIPTRSGNGAMDRLEVSREWIRPSLHDLEEAFDTCLGVRRGRVFADTWNLDEFSSCAECLPVRRQRLEEMNLTQQVALSVTCQHCVA